MGMDMFVYTESPVEDSSVLVHLREWKETGGTWASKGKNWQVVVNSSLALEAADAGSERDEVMRIRPRVRFRTEINIEGRQSTEAMTIATCSAQKIAFRLHGLIHDPQLEALIVPLSEGPFARIPAPAPRGGLKRPPAPARLHREVQPITRPGASSLFPPT